MDNFSHSSIRSESPLRTDEAEKLDYSSSNHPKPRTPPPRPPLPPPLHQPPPEPSLSLPQSQSNAGYITTTSPVDGFSHSSTRSEFPLRSDEPEKLDCGGCGVIVAVEKYYSPSTSPLPVTLPKDGSTPNTLTNSCSNSDSHVINFNQREEPAVEAIVMGGGGVGKGGGRRGTWWSKRRGLGSVEEVANKSDKEEMMRKVTFFFRIFESVVCLISLSVMAADKTQGWSGDSFDRYKEYRFCLSANVIGFVYSGFQACDLAYHLVNGKHMIAHHLRYHFDFTMDQIMAYLLIAASSAGATRVVDWVSNWGKDEFTEKASASISMSFLAFIAFALSSLISGYNFFKHDDFR